MNLPLFLVALHFVADWPLQTNKMALNKSKSWEALTSHVLIYTLVFWVALCLMGYQDGFLYGFTAITFVTHFVTDAITSRITSKLWFIRMFAVNRAEINRRLKMSLFRKGDFIASISMKKRGRFFDMIGLDQLIHYVTLALTWNLLQ